jgi:hypothetical protein
MRALPTVWISVVYIDSTRTCHVIIYSCQRRGQINCWRNNSTWCRYSNDEANTTQLNGCIKWWVRYNENVVNFNWDFNGGVSNRDPTQWRHSFTSKIISRRQKKQLLNRTRPHYVTPCAPDALAMTALDECDASLWLVRSWWWNTTVSSVHWLEVRAVKLR